MYVVPRYTEISHFRAPYKTSAIYTGVEGFGLDAIRTTSPSTASASTSSGGGTVSQEEAARVAAGFTAGMAKYWEAKNYDQVGRAHAFANALHVDAVARYRANNSIAPWQNLPTNWPVLILQTKVDIAIDPNSTWRKNLRVEAKKAFGYGQTLNQPIGEGFLGKVAMAVTDPPASKSLGASMYQNAADKPALDKIKELVWRLSVEEANNARDEMLREQQKPVTTFAKPVTTFAPSRTQAARPVAVTPSRGGGGGAAADSGAAAEPAQPATCPAGYFGTPPNCVPVPAQVTPTMAPPATAGIMKALPWVAAVGAAGVVVWLVVKKK